MIHDNKKNEIVIYHHLGLGDHFVCNGLVRKIVDKDNPDFLYLPTKRNNFATVSQMYSDDRRIICLPVNDDRDVYFLPQLNNGSKVYYVGFEKCRHFDWDVSFYDSVNIPFECRWNRFSVNRNFDKEVEIKKILGLKQDEKFILVHDECSDQKFSLEITNNCRIVKVEKITDSLIDWCGVIEEAEEVHCVDSSVIHLAQSLNIKSGVYHDLRKSNAFFQLKPSWKTVSYA